MRGQTNYTRLPVNQTNSMSLNIGMRAPPRRVEALVHARLSARRVNPRREFFTVKYEHIRAVIEKLS